MSKQLFGTDGIRGVAGEFPLDERTVYAFGAALGAWAATQESPQVLIGMDTRESGPWLTEAVAAGLNATGARPSFAGLITTPGVAWVTRHGPFSAGVMISASHNPFHDNGLKVFGHNGYKLPDSEEHRIETEIFQLLETDLKPKRLSVPVDEHLDSEYLDYLAASCEHTLDGLPVTVDCANGAASHLAPALFERLGASVNAIGCTPDGRNINRDCGSLHLDGLRNAAAERGAVGVAFDGDADRALFVAQSGKIIDGDHVLLAAGTHLQSKGRLKQDTVVATVMSNLGLERALAARGIRLLRTSVGDKYVLEEMVARGAVLGGEQSGHVIFLEHATTGDGLLTGLQVLGIMAATGLSLEALTEDLVIYPQRLVNVRVKNKRPLAELAQVNQAIRETEALFGDSGRVLVRFSGTEPLARVMVEGPDMALVEAHAKRIASAIEAELA